MTGILPVDKMKQRYKPKIRPMNYIPIQYLPSWRKAKDGYNKTLKPVSSEPRHKLKLIWKYLLNTSFSSVVLFALRAETI